MMELSTMGKKVPEYSEHIQKIYKDTWFSFLKDLFAFYLALLPVSHQFMEPSIFCRGIP